METFKDSGLRDDVKRAVAELGFTTPTPIQAQVIPLILDSSRDLVALARTGTGKTAGFGLPVVDGIDLDSPSVQALILCPTRELCLQIAKDLDGFARFRNGVKVAAVYGGAPITHQIREIKDGAQIIVGTPGRTLDLITRGKLKVDQLKRVVLDEADEMLNMGFQEELNGILASTPEDKQTLLFSATMPKEARKISEEYMRNPTEISVGHADAGNSKVVHQYFKVRGSDRFALLRLLVELDPEMYAVIFCRTRLEVNGVSEDLRFAGHSADALHGDMSQAQRDDVMNRFRRRRVKLLVATDVAARGLDVQDLTHVINYNLPDAPEVYVHRSGRTGRAGKEGIAMSIVTGREVRHLRAIENYSGISFQLRDVPSQNEVYRLRALRFAENVLAAKLDDKVAAYLPEVIDMFAEMDREEIIQKILGYGLGTLSAQLSGQKQIQNDDTKDNRLEKGSADFTTICMSVGKKHGYTVPQIIGMMNRRLPGKKISFGKIDIQNNLTYVGVDSKEAKKVVAAFEGAVDKGVEMNVRIFEDGTKIDAPWKGGGKKKKQYQPGGFKPKSKKPHRGQ
ncbi:DEAD/DEAH box helicase [Neolewinella lacunae]|uniref:DEAD/DEAH box helicase n=1 Tax=Neolewinella lacunae TaxID=1517758 RepID=A0A923PHX5_9BACT|nr:DEAD/DEAH box helicase [Neolewinella lacunae]MBC6992915.1 DEAD/DEAH box helicase [Neolewinella lacunae]MDN3633721.1 DEAD/DEAH box helicase [Neolewinella lacunae]